MKTQMTEMFGIELPIFAFSHCRDVVVEVSKAGGFGVLGCSRYSPEALEQELKWIDEHIDGKPYGVDILMPAKIKRGITGDKKLDLDEILPKEHMEFIDGILDKAGIPPLPAEEKEAITNESIMMLSIQPEEVEELLNVVYKHPIKMIVSALGTPPQDQVERAHAQGIKVGALAGNLKHGLLHKQVGVDVVIAQGHEAGGHTGRITSMILWPELIEALDPLPVLAAGGVGRGSQMAAALVMGAAGVWCGSIWLGTKQSEFTQEQKELLFEASSEDTVQSRHRSGKPVRMLRGKMTDMWLEPGAPPTLGMPLQSILMSSPHVRILRAGAKGKYYMSPIIGQIVGMMKQETNTRRVIEDMVVEFADSVQRLMETVE